jgi:hypothetical protein
MNSRTGLKIQIAAAWCGPVCIALYLVFWGILGHNIPPPSPSYNAQELIANYYGPYHDQILIGMVAASAVGILYLPWSCQLSNIMRREEHSVPVLSNIELLGGAITAWLLAECAAMWAHAAHYGTSNPELTEMLWRESWFIFDLTYMITTMQMVGAGIYALTDKSRNPVFPRWTGWWAIAGGLTYVPLSLVAYITDGPFAWNGLWNFWTVWSAWVTWFVIDNFYLMRYLRGKLRAAGASSPVEPDREPTLA